MTTTGGPWTVAGTTYSYRSASLTANAVLTAAAKTYSVTASDFAVNQTTGNFNVTVDNTVPTISATAVASSTDTTVDFRIRAQRYFGSIANSTDAAGILTVTANMGNLTTGQTTAPLTTAGGPGPSG